MFLHELSRRITSSLRLAVSDAAYADAVAAEFGSNCCYCSRLLEKDRAAVEHLDGMNRFRLGLHIPGNVIVACKKCNGEKRRDDQVSTLALAPTGWESFLSHDSTNCIPTCLNCEYWRTIWIDSAERVEKMRGAKAKIMAFRERYPEFLDWGSRAKKHLGPIMDSLYRECQQFASVQIAKAVDDSFSKLAALNELTAPRMLSKKAGE